MELRINMIYFSQTGNTKKVAKAIGEQFKENGHMAQIMPIESADSSLVLDCDLIGIGCPCFTSRVPTPVSKFVEGIPYLNGKPAFIFATSGGAPGRVLYDLKVLLEKRGAKVIGGLLVRGELFYPVPCLKGRFHGRPDNYDIDRARHFAKSILEHISDSENVTYDEGSPKLLKRRLNLYNAVGVILSDSLIHALLPEPKFDHGKCEKCGACARGCPTGSISLKPFPVLGGNCIRCYNCLNVCPEEAVRTNMTRANLIISSLYGKTFERIFGDVEKGEKM
jgi:flavodoxin/ferredoxin